MKFIIGKIYDPEDLIYVKADGSVATKKDYDNKETLAGGKYYLKASFVEARIDNALESIRFLLN